VDLLIYMQRHLHEILTLTLQHLWLAFLAVAISTVIGVACGILLSRVRPLAGPVIGIAGVFYTIPSLALFGFLIPMMGIGVRPALLALILYAQLVLIRNTYVGILEVDPASLEAGRGMGMRGWQLLLLIELPLALPVVMAGIRTTAVMSIGIAAIASYIGAGGLGTLIFQGISRVDSVLILAGAIPVSLLAIATDAALAAVERALRPWADVRRATS
jgi:ABC-type proline/glycine betaine transport system permease subunit